MEAHPVCAEEREAGFFRVPLDGQLSQEAGENGLKSLFRKARAGCGSSLKRGKHESCCIGQEAVSQVQSGQAARRGLRHLRSPEAQAAPGVERWAPEGVGGKAVDVGRQ